MPLFCVVMMMFNVQALLAYFFKKYDDEIMKSGI